MVAIPLNRIKGGVIMAYDIAMDVNTNDIILQDNDFMMIDKAERVAQQI